MCFFDTSSMSKAIEIKTPAGNTRDKLVKALSKLKKNNWFKFQDSRYDRTKVFKNNPP